jgi:hypothetical protein
MKSDETDRSTKMRDTRHSGVTREVKKEREEREDRG